MNRHKRIRIVIDLVVTEPTTTYSAIPLDAPVKPEQEGFTAPCFGTTHLTRGQS